MAPDPELGLTEVVARLRDPGIPGREFQQHPLEVGDGIAPLAAPHPALRQAEERIHLLGAGALRLCGDLGGGAPGFGGASTSAARDGQSPNGEQVRTDAVHRESGPVFGSAVRVSPSAASLARAFPLKESETVSDAIA